MTLIWVSNSLAEDCTSSDYSGHVVFGDPKETDFYTKEELEKSSIVGKYVSEEYAAKCVISIEHIKSILK